MKCNYCNTDPGTNGNGVWKGFQDQDNGKYCCRGCRDIHYTEKFAGELKGLYSEVPVVVNESISPAGDQLSLSI